MVCFNLMKKGFKDYIVVRIKRTGHNLVTAATGLRNFFVTPIHGIFPK